MKNIAEKLKELRIKNGLSQEKLAEQLMVSRQAVSKWETGEALPDMENMIALARLYGTSLDELAGIIVNKEENREDSESHGGENNESRSEGDTTVKADIKADIQKDGDKVRINIEGLNIEVNDHDDEDLEDLEDLEEILEDLDDGEKVKINIGSGGIKIGEEGIRIGNKIKIDSDGININNGKVKIGSAGIIIDDGKDKPQSKLVRVLRAVPYPVIAAVAYLLLGFLADAWGIAWILFCTIPVYYGIVDCIAAGKLSHFPYVTLTPCIYLYLGMQYGLWHPAWIIFCTIPIFYPIAHSIDKLICDLKNRKKEN